MKKKTYVRMALLSMTMTASMTSGMTAQADSFSFGVMSDTQWKANVDGGNPETVAVGIINQLNQQFINHQVKFVIQVGDLTDKETDSPNGFPLNRTMDTRAAAAKPLNDAGICFFPLRGNHEGSALAAQEFVNLFPQTTGNGTTCGAKNFSSPFDKLSGLSYSFDYDHTRFVLLDQFTRLDNTNNNNSANDNILDQLTWIDANLTNKGVDNHGFVFSHKNLIGANHQDGIFGASPASNPEAQNAYYSSLQSNGVHYQFSGHDHNHLRSIVLSPDKNWSVQNIITSSNSYKFYTPQIPSLDEKYNFPAFGFLRETPISQELYTVGYYIVNVDGPRVTVDHFASDNSCGALGAGVDCDLVTTPHLNFEKRETFGYSLNGKEFLVAQGSSYESVQDSFKGTKVKILNGVNGSTLHLFDGRATTKTVNTGWTSKTDTNDQEILASNILTLWGMTDLGSDEIDSYVLSMSYDKMPSHQGNGGFGIATKDADGNWINAVDMNFGGDQKFVHGPWKPSYEIGTYGVDPATKTAWAVINYNGDFAVARDIEPVPGHQRY